MTQHIDIRAKPHQRAKYHQINERHPRRRRNIRQGKAVELPAHLVRKGELALQTPGQATALTAVRDDAGAVIGVLAGSRVMWRVAGAR